MNNPSAPAPCPKCGCALIWNGRTTSCMSCSYVVIETKSEQRLPAAKSRQKRRRSNER